MTNITSEEKKANFPTWELVFTGLTAEEKFTLTARGTYVDDGDTTTATLKAPNRDLLDSWLARKNLDAKLSN